MKRKIIISILAGLLCMPAFAEMNYSRLTSGISQISIMKSYNDESKNPIIINKMKTQTKNLSKDDKNVISKYIYGAVKGENTFLLINSYLRKNLDRYISPHEITIPLECRLEYYVNALDSALSKNRLPKNMILYADASEDFIDKTSEQINEENLKILKKEILGKVFTEKGFLIVSYDKNEVKKSKFRYEIKAPKNLQATLLEGANTKESKNIVINRGYKWKITDISIQENKLKKNKYYNIIIRLVL